MKPSGAGREVTTWMNTVLLGFSENVYEAAPNDTNAAGTIYNKRKMVYSTYCIYMTFPITLITKF